MRCSARKVRRDSDHFAVVPQKVTSFLLACHASAFEFAFVNTLYSFHSKTSPRPFAALHTIARRAGMDRRRAWEARKALDRDGILPVRTGVAHDGYKESNEYDLPALEKLAEEKPEGVARTKRRRERDLSRFQRADPAAPVYTGGDPECSAATDERKDSDCERPEPAPACTSEPEAAPGATASSSDPTNRWPLRRKGTRPFSRDEFQRTRDAARWMLLTQEAPALVPSPVPAPIAALLNGSVMTRAEMEDATRVIATAWQQRDDGDAPAEGADLADVPVDRVPYAETEATDVSEQMRALEARWAEQADEPASDR